MKHLNCTLKPAFDLCIENDIIYDFIILRYMGKHRYDVLYMPDLKSFSQSVFE